MTDQKYPYLVFFATIFIYSMHRIIGFGKLERITNNTRINTILKFQKHIILYGLIGLVGLIISSLFIPFSIILWLSIPALLALVYILPIFGHKKRFRDLPFIKIFAIGVVWTWACVFIPMVYDNASLNLNQVIFIFEKLLFIISITIPFDIRDLKVDNLHKIKTIPIELGEEKSKKIALAGIFICWVLVGLNYFSGFLTWSTWLALTFSYLITASIIFLINEKSHDYYFTGLLDGTIILQMILILFFNQMF
ncbi:MAG: UbiA family prenyltransferase [Saprospiraceae bacterium]|nr:UbiA family prenyltransferase [Saprospiraceae bacterium]